MLRTGDFLLDTNIVIRLLNQNAFEMNLEMHFSNIYISSIVIGELMYGAYNSKKVEENCNKVINFVEDFYILDLDLDIAVEYGKIKSELKKKGRPIPENDIWIAAVAKHNNLILLTSDAHFNEIENLKIENL